jgi:DNA ligase-1
MEYSAIASALEEVGGRERTEKAGVVANLLASLAQGLICPAVRLLLGELWPPWEGREMGIGPDAVLDALKELSRADLERTGEEDLGDLAQAALQRRSQHPLTAEPLEAIEVYHSLRRISEQSGPGSQSRKGALLRGLLLRASPLEAKYIARTAMRSIQAGLGPQTMMAAIARAFGASLSQVGQAYSRLPELGAVALAASRGELAEIRIRPQTPVKPMLFRPSPWAEIGPGKRAYLLKHPGLRVQVHLAHGSFFVYTMRLREISSALSSLSKDVQSLGRDLILEADLVGLQNGGMASPGELVRYINRGHLSRWSLLSLSLRAWDLLFLDKEDLTGLRYQQRRRRLEAVLREAPDGISLAEERVLDRIQGEEYFRFSVAKGFWGLVSRELDGPYQPGSYGSDLLLRESGQRISAVIVGAEHGRGMRAGLLTGYRVALRSGDGYAPVGKVSAGLRRSDAELLAEELRRLVISEDEDNLQVLPQLLLSVKVAGARRDGRDYSLIRPRIEEVKFDASLEEVDPLEILDGFL